MEQKALSLLVLEHSTTVFRNESLMNLGVSWGSIVPFGCDDFDIKIGAPARPNFINQMMLKRHD